MLSRFARSLVLFLAITGLALAAPERWAKDIAAYVQADQAHPPAKHGIVFVGSSSIALWQTLHADFPGLPVIGRGFGGSQIGDSVHYADQIVLPYEPRVVVLYSGENDLAEKRTPESVAEQFRAFVQKVQAANPQTCILYISMKPSPSRWALKDAMIRGNELIAAQCAADPRLTFVDVWPVMLGADGKPREELFIGDKLHLNAAGYAAWTKLLTPLLQEALGHKR